MMHDYEYVEIGSLPLAEWLAYWSLGNEATWDGDLHDVAQLRGELCEASAYVRKLLTEIDQLVDEHPQNHRGNTERDSLCGCGRVDCNGDCQPIFEPYA